MIVEQPAPGSYVVAVSGGVDSVALLHNLAQSDKLRLYVAHFDHGIRQDSAEDARFVSQLARQYGLEYFSERAELGQNSSEALARTKRYKFLYSVMAQTQANAVITAHHQDDVLETAILNMLRGTGRKGLTSLQSTNTLVRPLLSASKSEITDYALQQKLSWHEDTTNHDERYTRNYIRHRLLVKFDSSARQQLLQIIERQRRCNDQIDQLLDPITHKLYMSQQQLVGTPHELTREMLASWLRYHGVADFSKQTIERLAVHVKTKPVGTRLDVHGGAYIFINHKRLEFNQLAR